MYIKSKTQDNFFHKDLINSERNFQTPRNILNSNNQLSVLYQKSKPVSSITKSSAKRNFSQTSMGFYQPKINYSLVQKISRTTLNSSKMLLKSKINSILRDYKKPTIKDSNKLLQNRNKYSRSNQRFASLATPRIIKDQCNSCFFSHEETEKEMNDKFKSCTNNLSLLKKEENNNLSQKNFRQILIRDFGIIKASDFQPSQLERSKQLYNKQSDFDSDYIQVFKKQNLNELCRQQIDNYYKRRLEKKEANSKRIADEIREMICPDYEEIIVQPRSKSVGGKINYQNLERKIKVFHISKYTFDIDNDDLGIKNLPKLKTNLKNISKRSLKRSIKIVPKFIKGKVKDNTIKKYRSLFGMFFGTASKLY